MPIFKNLREKGPCIIHTRDSSVQKTLSIGGIQLTHYYTIIWAERNSFF